MSASDTTDTAAGDDTATDPASPAPAATSPIATSPTAKPATDPAVKAFSTSILISAVRCTLSYVVFPWILPIIGFKAGVGPWLGLAIGVIAIGFNIASIRRFWITGHRWRWVVTTLNVIVIVMLCVLISIDLRELF
jgi:hypothetical protein